MWVLRSREEIESLLRTELETAEHDLQAEQSPEARQHFKTALHRFTRLVVYDEVPKELQCS